MNKAEFTKFLAVARKALNRTWVESRSVDRCVPFTTKHKRWVYRLYRTRGVWYAHCYEKDEWGLHDVYYEYTSHGWAGPVNMP